jgi:hypothetical protein
MSVGVQRCCQACNRSFGQRSGPGRPRKFCQKCVPPGTGSAASRAWRAANPDRVAEINKSRRKRRWNVYLQQFEES